MTLTNTSPFSVVQRSLTTDGTDLSSNSHRDDVSHGGAQDQLGGPYDTAALAPPPQHVRTVLRRES
eukprot:715479-Hanusia_phi.AAC.1